MRGLLAFTSVFAFAALVMAATAQPVGDAAKGAKLWDHCKTCHQIGPDAEDRIGPHLNGLFGRRAAAHADFDYSAPMRRAGTDGLVWTHGTLDAYVENPKALVSGTRMTYRGMLEEADRADLLAFLRIYSDNPRDIPEAALIARQPAALPSGIPAIKGDPEFGEYLAAECTSCHQASGKVSGIPAITGWPEEDFVAAMHGYRSKLRPHPVMQMMAGRLSNDEIAALAAYFATLSN